MLYGPSSLAGANDEEPQLVILIGNFDTELELGVIHSFPLLGPLVK